MYAFGYELNERVRLVSSLRLQSALICADDIIIYGVTMFVRPRPKPGTEVVEATSRYISFAS